MIIFTARLPQTDLKEIDDLVGENKIYTSRSELFRVAIKEFIINELDAANLLSKPMQIEQSKTITIETQTFHIIQK